MWLGRVGGQLLLLLPLVLLDSNPEMNVGENALDSHSLSLTQARQNRKGEKARATRLGFEFVARFLAFF